MKQTQTTPFLELANRIDEDIECSWYCCGYLPGNVQWFVEMFKPTLNECYRYDMYTSGWLGEISKTRLENNQFRILILLLAHEVWLDEQNGKK